MNSVRSLGAFVIASTICWMSPVFADVIVVDVSGGGDFTSIQPAVDAAFDDDLILVRTGSYPAFTIDNKTLTIVEDIGAGVSVPSGITVENLAASKRVQLINLSVNGASFPTPALLARNNLGAVRALNCNFSGESGGSIGGKGVELQNSSQVVFAGCAISGGDGGTYYGYGGPGGGGVISTDSTVAFYNCVIDGGVGDTDHTSFAHGGAAVSSFNGTIFASGTEMSGGSGGDALGIDGALGNGGNGLNASGVGTVTLLDCPLEAGLAGTGLCFCPPAVDGVPLAGSIVPELINLTRRSMDFPVPVHDGTTMPIVFGGESGDLVFTIHSATPGYLYFPELSGVQLVQNGKVRVHGQIDMTGMKSKNISLNVLSPGMDSIEVELQSVFYSAGSATPQFIFGPASRIVILNPAL